MLISVILPVYNGEKYVSKCLDSLMNQTFRNFEIILINDGSTDHTNDICRYYKKKYPEIKYLVQKNSGVSSARNLGLKAATGDWLTFVDADDFVDQQYLYSLYKEQIRTGADWIASEFTNYQLTSDIYDIRSSFNENIYFDENIREHVSAKILWNRSLQRLGNPVSKLYKSSILRKFHIKFNEKLKLYEDTFFNFEYSMHIKSFAYLHESHYMRLMHENSAIHVYRRNALEETLRATNVYMHLKKKYHWANESDVHLYISFALDSFHFYVFNNPNLNDIEKKDIHKKYYAFLNQQPMKRFWRQVHIRNGYGMKEKIIIACIKLHCLSLWEAIHSMKRKL